MISIYKRHGSTFLGYCTQKSDKLNVSPLIWYLKGVKKLLPSKQNSATLSILFKIANDIPPSKLEYAHNPAQPHQG